MEDTTLIEYLKGGLEADECTKVEKWYNNSPQNKKKLEDLYFLIFVSDRLDAIKNVDEDKSFIEFKERIEKRKPAPVKQLTTFKRAMAIAAIFIGLLFMGSTLTLFLLDKTSQSITVSTQLGERAQVTLPDGTKVWLNACSNIEYSKSYLGRQRKVKLDGEGYFEVESMKNFPFVVSNKSSQIKVLGTHFNVRCNDDDNNITASLLEGSILFSDKTNDLQVLLKPGEEIIYDRNNNKYTLQAIHSNDDIVGWIDGKIVFTNATLDQIARKLERHYNVKISFADESVKKERFNADFEASDNIYQVISILGTTKKFKYEFQKSNREIIISSIQ